MLGKVHNENLGSVLPPGQGRVPERQCLLRVEPNTLRDRGQWDTRLRGCLTMTVFLEHLLYATYIGNKAQKFIIFSFQL